MKKGDYVVYEGKLIELEEQDDDGTWCGMTDEDYIWCIDANEIVPVTFPLLMRMWGDTDREKHVSVKSIIKIDDDKVREGLARYFAKVYDGVVDEDGDRTEYEVPMWQLQTIPKDNG